jgi:hypothetical protein
VIAFQLKDGSIIDSEETQYRPKFIDRYLLKENSIVNETYIIGSGKSLNSLKAEEIEHINGSELVISFNKYLIFHERIGIIPHVHLQFDAADEPSYYVFLRTLERIQNDRRLQNIHLGTNPTLIEEARFYLPEKKLFQISDNMEFWRNPGFREQRWATSLTEKMFHFRGSLTSAINFANIVHPANIIKLVGVDMGSNEYFFQSDYEADTSFHDWTYRLMKETGVHSNICTNDKLGGISQEVCIEFIRDMIRSTGGDLVTVNPLSYYAQKGILNSARIIESSTENGDFKLTSFLLKDNIDSLIRRPSRCRHFYLILRLKLKLLIFRMRNRLYKTKSS